MPMPGDQREECRGLAVRQRVPPAVVREGRCHVDGDHPDDRQSAGEVDPVDAPTARRRHGGVGGRTGARMAGACAAVSRLNLRIAGQRSGRPRWPAGDVWCPAPSGSRPARPWHAGPGGRGPVAPRGCARRPRPRPVPPAGARWPRRVRRTAMVVRAGRRSSARHTASWRLVPRSSSGSGVSDDRPAMASRTARAASSPAASCRRSVASGQRAWTSSSTASLPVEAANPSCSTPRSVVTATSGPRRCGCTSQRAVMPVPPARASPGVTASTVTSRSWIATR